MAIKIYKRLTSGTDADYTLHSTETTAPKVVGGLTASTGYTFRLDLVNAGGAVTDSEVVTATTNAGGFVDIPDTFPTGYTTFHTNVYGNSLIAAEGAGSTGNILTRLQPLLDTSGKTVYLGVTGNNGMASRTMKSDSYMQNFVYSRYYDYTAAPLKILIITEWVNELSWYIPDEPTMTVAQMGQALLDDMIEISQKARNIGNSNPLFLKPGGGPADPGDGYRVGIVIPVDCARVDYRPVFNWIVTELKANYRQYANFLVDESDIPYMMPDAAGPEGYTGATPYYRDGTHHTELGELIYTDGMRRAIFNYLGITIPNDIASLTASLASGTVTASVTSISAIEYRIKVGTGAWSAWQGYGEFTGVVGTDYIVEARMIVKPSASLSYTSSGGSVTYETETDAHIAAVEGAGGTVPDKDFLNDFILHAKANSYLSVLAWAGGTPTGYKEEAGVQSRAYGINSFPLTSVSGTRKPDLINNSLGRPVYYFEGQDTFGDNDEMHGGLDSNAIALVSGVKDLTMIAVGKLANRTTTNGQSLFSLAGFESGMDIGTDAAGNYMVARAGNATHVKVTEAGTNTGGNVVLCGTLKADTKVLDLWRDGTKRNTTTISETLYPTTPDTLFAGAAGHGYPTLGNFEFAVILGARPSDTIVASIQNFLLTNLPNA